MKKIAIIGAGGFGREVKTIIDAINDSQSTKCYQFVGFFDDGFQMGNTINGFPVLGRVEDLNHISEPLSVVVAIGNPVTKKKVIHAITENKNLSFPTIIHPSVMISKDQVTIGEGNIICGGTIITCNIEIKNFVILNLMCTVGHDAIINSFSSFMPSVNISGEVLIEEAVYVGTGAKVLNQLTIGKNTIVGAGAVVAKTLPENCTAVGIPAKPIKFHND